MNHRPLSLEKVTAYIKKEYLYIGALVSFIVVATVISLSFSRDSVAYNSMFVMYGSSGWSKFTTEMLQRETFFLAVSKIFYQLGLGSVFLFLIHSVISVSVKFYLIDKYSKDKWLSLAFFSSYFFILHDSTQIRFGMAVAFVYLGLNYLADGKRLLFSAVVILSAVMFHFSSFAFIVMLCFTSKKSLLWLLVMVVFAVLLYPVNLQTILFDLVGGVIDYFDIHGTFINKLQASFLQKPVIGGGLGLFTWRMLLVYLCAVVLFQYRDVFSRFEVLCYNAFIFSVFVYILMKDVLIIPYRVSGLFGFSMVFLVPYVHQWLSEYMGKRNAYILLLLFFTVTLLKFTLYDKMIVI